MDQPMKSPMIKPSHKGLLHKNLGIPQGDKIPRARLEEAKHSSNPAIRKRANFALNFNDAGAHGTVCEMTTHTNGKHAVIEVVHGRKPTLTKEEKAKQREHGGYPSYDDRPRSRIVVPKDKAHMFHVGQKVGVGAIPLEGPDTDEMDDPSAGDDGDDLDSTMQDIRGYSAAERKRR